MAHLSYEDGRRIVELFYALRNSVGRDPSSAETEECFKAFKRAYIAHTSGSLSRFPEPAERRRWISALFACLVSEIDFEIWNSTLPAEGGCQEVA